MYDIYRLLNNYKNIFSHYDTNNLGQIEPHQLSICISKLGKYFVLLNFNYLIFCFIQFFKGFYLSPNAIKLIVDHYSLPFYSASAITPLSKANIDAHNVTSQITNSQQSNDFYVNDLRFETEKRFKITFLQYIKCCTKLKALSEVFHERDLDQNRKPTGSCNFNYEEVRFNIYY